MRRGNRMFCHSCNIETWVSQFESERFIDRRAGCFARPHLKESYVVDGGTQSQRGGDAWRVLRLGSWSDRACTFFPVVVGTSGTRTILHVQYQLQKTAAPPRKNFKLPVKPNRRGGAQHCSRRGPDDHAARRVSVGAAPSTADCGAGRGQQQHWHSGWQGQPAAPTDAVTS